MQFVHNRLLTTVSEDVEVLENLRTNHFFVEQLSLTWPMYLFSDTTASYRKISEANSGGYLLKYGTDGCLRTYIYCKNEISGREKNWKYQQWIFGLVDRGGDPPLQLLIEKSSLIN